ncbi:MAG: DUF2975 domain-containing protein [Saprospiraceae bacterium]|nr:DUF2975 domain-containing protein [Saprospiraceae bacterium]
MSERNDFIWKALNVISWIIFLALCVETGSILFNTVYALFNPIVAKYYWKGNDLSLLYNFSKNHFVFLTVLMSIAIAIRAVIFYRIVKLFHSKKLDINQPFNTHVSRTVHHIAYLCLGTGIVSMLASGYAAWISEQGVQIPGDHALKIGGADVWLFMAVVLMVVGQMLNKGIELQNENDLTI